MSTVVPQGGASQANAAGSAPVITVAKPVSVPKSASSILESGRSLSGQVLDKPQSGQVTIQTDQGSITLKTSSPPPQGSTVTLSQPPGGGTDRIQIQQTAPQQPPPPPAPTGDSRPAQPAPSQQQQPSNTTTAQTGGQTPQRTGTQTQSNAPLPPPVKAQPVHLPTGAASALESGRPLPGRVLDNPKPGQVSIQTARGTVTLETANPPPRGSQVNLTLLNSLSSGSQAPKIQIQPLPPAQTQSPPATQPPSPPPAPPPGNQQGAPPPAQGQGGQGRQTGQAAIIQKSSEQPNSQTYSLPATSRNAAPLPPVNARPVDIPRQAALSLDAGKSLKGLVLEAPRNGQVAIRTAQGTVTLATSSPPPRDTQVTLSQFGGSSASGQPPRVQIQPAPLNQQPPQVQQQLQPPQQQQPRTTAAPGNQSANPPQTAPTTAPALRQAQGGNPPPVSAQPVNLPKDAAATLAAGRPINGQVIEPPKPGHVAVQTRQGKVTLETANPPPKGMQVTLTQSTATAAGQPPRIQIQPAPTAQNSTALPQAQQVPGSTTQQSLQAAAQPAQSGTAQSQTPQIQTTAQPQAQPASPPPPQSSASLLQAQHTSPPNARPASPQAPQPQGQSTPSVSAQQSAPPPNPAPPNPALPNPAAQSRAAPSGNSRPASRPAQNPLPSSGRPVTVPKAAANLLEAGNPLNGQVTDQPRTGQVTIQTSQGKVTVETANPPPKGTQVTLSQPSASTIPGQAPRIQIQPAPLPQQPPQVRQQFQAQQPQQTAQTQTTAPNQQATQVQQPVQTPTTPPSSGNQPLNQPAQQNNAPLPAVKADPVDIPRGAATALESGRPLPGQVQDSPQPRQTVIQTARGNVTVETNAPLPRGTNVTLTQSPAGADGGAKIQVQPAPLNQQPPQVQNQLQAQSANTVQPQSNPTAAAGTSGAQQGQPGQSANLLNQANSILSRLISGQPASPSQPVTTTLTQGSSYLATILGDGKSLLNPLPAATGQGQAVPGSSLPGQGLQGLPLQSGQSTTAPAGQTGQVPPAAAQGQPGTTAGTPAGTPAGTSTAGSQPAGQTIQPGTSQQGPANASDAQQPQGAVAKLAQALKGAVGGAKPAADIQLPGGHSVPVRVLNIALPGTGALPPYPAAALESGNPLLSGTVSASGKGQSIVQTSAGAISLPTTQPLPPGTLIQLMVTGSPKLSETAAQLSQADMGLRWQALHEAMILMQAGNPEAATRLLQVIPQSNPMLGTTLLFLFNAMRGGTIDRWLGKDTLKALDAAKKGSAGRLSGSFQTAQARTTDSAGQDWRVYHMPVLADANLDDVKLYLRDRQEEEDSPDRGKDKDDKRFIVEANFATLGPMQFDGMSRKKQLDLMVRTQIPLEPDMRDGIRSIFQNTISALGMSGGVGFHVAQQFDVTVDEVSSAKKGGVTI